MWKTGEQSKGIQIFIVLFFQIVDRLKNFKIKKQYKKIKQIALAGVAGSMDWAPACEPKGCWFNS